MRMSTKARMNRLFTNGGCLDVALDPGADVAPVLDGRGAVVGRAALVLWSIPPGSARPRWGRTLARVR